MAATHSESESPNSPSITSFDSECCLFCAEWAGELKKSNYAKLSGDFEKGRIIWRESGWALLPSLGPLAYGHLLLIPEEHVLSFSELPSSRLTEAEAIVRRVGAFWGDLGVLFFEHGIVNRRTHDPARMAMLRAGCCTDHAHLHLVPGIPFPLVEEMLNLHARPQPLNALAELGNLNPQLDCECYVLLGSSGHGQSVYYFHQLPSQYMRQVVARVTKSDSWDWRVSPKVMEVTALIGSVGHELRKYLSARQL